ncbi:hypothetical protein [Siminovitchia terrae]|nr:hypothetical protein [Siminovitchia terrae]
MKRVWGCPDRHCPPIKQPVSELNQISEIEDLFVLKRKWTVLEK